MPLLRAAFQSLRKEAAAGVDGLDWYAFQENLERRLADLEDRLHRGGYHPPPVRRVFIPKADGKQRPLGVPTIEDKVVQQAVRMLLEPIYEKQFLGFSYGFRPGRSQHDALDALAVALKKRTNWVLDADLKSFFDTLHHGWLKKFLEHRIADRRLIHLIVRWLKAGVWEAGNVAQNEAGTPQGGVISPLLSNVYLHYVLDLWVNQWRKRYAKHEVYFVRYADDFVMAFENGNEARIFRAQLRRRLEAFGLMLNEQKTRLIRFGRYAREHRADGQKPDTFDFLGFTHIASTNQKGWFHLHRITAQKKRKAKYDELQVEIVRRRHAPVAETHAWLSRVLVGHYNYFGVPGNEMAMQRFRGQLQRAWYRQLERRSQRAHKTVAQWQKFEKHYELPRPRVVHPWPDQRFEAR